MQLEWDEAKRRSNIAKHGLDFIDAERVLEGYTLTFLDDRHEELRYVSTGLLRTIVVVIVHTPRQDVTRIVSMRKASKHETANYYKNF